MADKSWVHSGWMSKQGHKYTGWKNRYFVLTEDTLSYYKEEVAEGSSGREGALAGTLSLNQARVFPTMWAPDGMFGWMIVTQAGVKYPFRCFGFKDRETWLKKVNGLPCINTSEEDKKQALKGSWNFGSIAQRLSFSVSGTPSVKKDTTEKAFFRNENGGSSADSQQQVALFLTEAGLRHLVQRFADSGVTSVNQLCVEIANPTMTDEMLMAPPLSMSMGEIEKLRNAVESSAQKSDMQMKQFVSENGLNQFLEKFETYGVTTMRDLVDPTILNDDDLTVEIGMNPSQIAGFRSAATKFVAENPFTSTNDNRDEEDYDDDEEENEERMTMDEFFMLRNDVINSAYVQMGMPYIGKHGKCHPIFDVVLVGMKKSKRVRSYRFRTLRVFQEEQVLNETGFYIQRLSTSFPGTLTKSMFGLSLSEAELEERVRQLSVWIDELLRVRGAMSPRLRRATLMLLQLDEAQLFPESLSLGRDDTNAASNNATALSMSPPMPQAGEDLLTEVSISKGPSGLGFELKLEDGKVVICVLKPYPGGGQHPADLASPPIMDGDELVAVNGVKFGSDLNLALSTIVSAPANLTLTVKSKLNGSVGNLLGDWNVAMGSASLFITAHETSSEQGRGLLFVVMDVAQAWRCAVFVAPTDVHSITSRHFGASLLAPAKSLQLAKLFGNFLERSGNQGFVLKTPDSPAFAWSCLCEATDTIQVCYQRAFEQHGKSSAAQGTQSSRRSSAPQMVLGAGSSSAAAGAGGGAVLSPTTTSSRRSSAPQMVTSTITETGYRYGLVVDGVGPVSGVPASALRTVDTKQALANVRLGMQVEIDFKTHWTLGTITEIQEPAQEVSYQYQSQELVDDSDNEEDENETVSGMSNMALNTADEGDAEEVSINDHFGGLMSFEEFKDSLTRGIEVVKFNRRGQAAFRTLTLIGDHTLSWMTPKDALKDLSDAKKSKGNFDLRELVSVRPGEAIDPDAKKEGETGTATLRMYAKKHDDGKEMQATGHCLSLIFPGRSVDIATDSVAHRDHLLNGFRLLAQRGPSGGRLLSVELTQKSKSVGFTVKSEVKSSGVVEMVISVHNVIQGSEADKAHLKAGDRIYQINGQQQNKWLSSKPATPAKFASLIQLKLNKLSNQKKPLEIVVERLDLDKHLAATEAATTLKVARERKLAEWLRAHGLDKFTVALIKLGVGSVDDLKLNKVPKWELMSPKKVNMTKADWKKYTRALETYVIVDDGASDGPGAALKPSKRGSLEMGTETSRAGVSFGLKGPCGGRLVSVTFTEKSLGMIVGNMNDGTGKDKKRQGVYVVELKEGGDAESKGVLLQDRLHMINGVALSMTLGHRLVRKKVKAAKRPLHLILERMKQEDSGDFVSATTVAMNSYALTAAEEMEMEALLDLKANALQTPNPKAEAWMVSWREDNPITSWYHIKSEKLPNGRTVVTDVDLSNIDLTMSLVDLKQSLVNLNFLRDLALSGNAGIDGELATFDSEALPAIKTLYLHNCPNIRGHISALYSLKTLVTLNVDNNENIFGDAKETKKELPNLKVLSMRGLAAAEPSF